MSSKDPKRLFELFKATLRLPPEKRAAFVRDSCADPSERAMLQGLLEADQVNEIALPKLAMAGKETLAGLRSGSQQANTPTGLLGSVVGNYKVQSELGRGGMGVVFLAQQLSTGQLVALKCLRPVLSGEMQVDRFEQEAKILGKLDHVGIAKVFDAGTFKLNAGIHHYFAMEYVRGRDLREYVQEQSLNLHVILALIAAICDAVHHAHLQGIIHRDLKPDNILITTNGQPKVLDFGVSRVINRDQQLTTLGSDGAKLIGTLSYMSPEQAAGEHASVGMASDVYSMGVITFELLSGQLPHDLGDRSLLSAACVIRDDPPKSLREAKPSLPAEVETMVGKALDREPHRRYGSAAEFADDLRRFLRHEPIQARPPSTFYSIIKFTRRHRSLAWAVASAFLVLSVATLFSMRWALRAEESKRNAEWSNYRTTLNLAEADLRQDQLSRALGNLGKVEPGLRGWEWHYLMQRADQSSFSIDGAHWLLIWSVASSSDGTMAYSASGDGVVKAWDLTNGALLAEADDHNERVFAVANSPTDQLIATSSTDVRIRDRNTLETLRTVDAHSGTIHGLCFSPDGRLLASGDQNGKLLLSRASDGTLIHELEGHHAFLWELAFSSDGGRLASSDGKGIVRVWDVSTGKELTHIETDAGPAVGLSFSPDGSRLAIGSQDGVLRIADSGTGELIQSTKAHKDMIRDVIYSPDGTRIMSASNDCTIAVWDSLSLGPVARLTGHTAAVTSLSINADGTQLVSTSEDRSIKTWDAGLLIDGNLRYPMTDVAGFARDLDPTVFHTLSQDSIVSNHVLASGVTSSKNDPVELFDLTHCSIALNGALLVYGKTQGITQEPAKNAYVYTPEGIATLYRGQAAEFAGQCQDGATTWLDLLDFTVALCDSSSGREFQRIEGFTEVCKILTVDRQGRWIAAGDDGRFVVSIRSFRASKEQFALKGHSNSIEDLEFSPSGRWLLSASDDHSVKIWDTQTWNEVASLDSHGAMDVRATFHPDETRVASVSGDGYVRIWLTKNWDEILAIRLPPGSGRAWSIEFGPRGEQLFVVMDSGLHMLDGRLRTGVAHRPEFSR